MIKINFIRSVVYVNKFNESINDAELDEDQRA